jgi:hypothetical protein
LCGTCAASESVADTLVMIRMMATIHALENFEGHPEEICGGVWVR